jgi:protein-L-isoaspartate(D-aspartate) O-methyltransferase
MTLAAQSLASQATELNAARRAMIDSQLRVSGINQDWLLAAIARVPREDHVPVGARGHAYIDRAIPLDRGHAMPPPLVQAAILAEAAPQPGDRVLVVSQTGYLTALIEPLVQSVETVDASAAKAFQGKAAYDLILIDGAIEALPAGLVGALASASKADGTVALAPLADMGIPVLAEFAAPKAWSF